MDLYSLTKEIETELERLSDPERLIWAEKNYPSSMKMLGVTVPNIRPVVKDLNKTFQKSPPEEVVEFAMLLNATRILEAQQIAFEVLSNHKKARQSLTLDDLLVLGAGIDNWISVDTFAGLLAGPAWRKGQIPDEVIEDWATSEDKWWRRAAVVSTVALNQKARGGSGDAVRTLKICKLVAGDKDDMVVKGLSWALRELAKREPNPVIAFINEYEGILPARVTREVRRKIETGRKYN
jgi:3-methyladenine DNA glycosylase AlkD